MTENDKENKGEYGKSQADLRVAVVGNVDSGKTTLIGVLTGDELDDGRGSARSKIFVHRHEAANGRTSYCSQHILGFGNNIDEKEVVIVKQPVAASANATQKNRSYKNVVERSKRIMTLIDLAGHERYLKTTIAGLTGNYPDYGMLLVGANMGCTKQTKEHLQCCVALGLPLVCVITKMDICPSNVYSRTKTHLTRLLKVKKRKAFDIKNEDDLAFVLNNDNPKLVPIFSISCVTGDGMDIFKTYLSKLKPRRKEWNNDVDGNKMELAIDETFNVPGVGLVVSGNVMSGQIEQNTVGYLGPFTDGAYHKILLKTIHCKRVPVENCMIGKSCSVAIKTANRKQPLEREMIHRGMVIISENVERQATWQFQADIMVMHHSTSIRKNYECVIHVGLVRQTARLIDVNNECLRSGDKSNAIFKFIRRPVHIHVGQRFIFREGKTKGVGKISKIFPQQL